MANRFVVIAFLFLFSIVTACAGNQPKKDLERKDETYRSTLIGTWVAHYKNPASEFYGETTYLKTGKFNAIGYAKRNNKKRDIIFSGKWDIIDGNLVELLEKSNVLEPGRKSIDKIISISEEKLVLKNKRGKILTRIRKK